MGELIAELLAEGLTIEEIAEVIEIPYMFLPQGE